MKIDYFENTVEKLKREVDLLMKCAEQIMALPSTKNTHVNQFKQTAQGKLLKILQEQKLHKRGRCKRAS